MVYSLRRSHHMKDNTIAVNVLVHSYEVHNSCCYMLFSSFGIVFRLANNGW